MPDKSLLEYATDEERSELAELIAMLPLPGSQMRNKPQCLAYESLAEEILYGGAAGGGKSDLLLGLVRTQHTRSLLLRREFPDLEQTLISRSLEFFGDKKHYNDNKHLWQIDGRRIEFGHMKHIGTPQIPGDESQYASAPYDFIGFDQLEQFIQYAYEFMFSRARSTNKKQRVRVVSSANPVGEGVEWIMRRWAAWLDPSHPNPAKSGEIRWYKRDKDGKDVETTQGDPDAVSRTFIAAGLKDNPYLGDDYRRMLNNMPEPLRSALLNGDWTASLTDDAYQVIPRAWVKAAMSRWVEICPESEASKPVVLGNDIARGGDDYTTLAARRGSWFDRIQKTPGRQTPNGATAARVVVQYLETHGLAKRTDESIEYKDDGFSLPILETSVVVAVDVIGVGGSSYDTQRSLGINAQPVNFSEHSDATDVSGTQHFVNKRAEYYWAFRDALDPASGKNVMLPPDPELEGDLCAPRWKPQSNGIKLEEKDNIKERIGRSPDCGDATVMSWTGGTPTQIFI